MPRLEAGSLLLHLIGLTCLGLTCSLSPFLTKANQLDLVPHLGQHNVRLLRVLRCSLGLVDALQPVLLE